MKRIILSLLISGLCVSLFAQEPLPEYHFASGNWYLTAVRLYQSDVKARLAKVNVRVPQSGPMVYDFNARYENGLDDGQGGFGVHVFADSVSSGPSWGTGKSYLLWLNYDEKPITKGIPKGLSAQVYKSYTNSYMELVESVDLNQYLPLITYDVLNSPISFRIWVNGNTGEVRVYDPADPSLSRYYYFYVNKKDVPMKGNWIALRTNGIALSFGLGL